MDYSQFFAQSGDMMTCSSPTPDRETFTKTSYNVNGMRDEEYSKNFIKSLKEMVVRKLISPTFSEIIIHSIKAA